MQTPANEYGIHEDLSSRFDSIPCLPENTDLKKVRTYDISYVTYIIHIIMIFSQEHGNACWVAGWGQSQSNGVASDQLKSIGVNIFDHEYCKKHRFDKTFKIII